MERVGILTSGGDAQGMNAAVRAAARRAWSLDMEVMGIRRGFAGLIDGEIFPMTNRTVSDKINLGGTFLHTARSEKFLRASGQKEAVRQITRYGIEGLIIIGGDGSLAGGRALHERGIKIIGIPATIDNDLSYTDYSLGFDTAMNNIVRAVNKIRNTAVSHERVFVIEVMGRENGLLALEAGLAVGAESILIPEVSFSYNAIAEKLRKEYDRGKPHNIIIVAEGISEKNDSISPELALGRGAAYDVASVLRNKTGIEIRITVLGHVQRGGSPTAFDRINGSRMGARASELLNDGYSSRMVGLIHDQIEHHSIDEVLKKEKKIDRSLYDLAEIIG